MSKFSEKREEQATATGSGPRWLWLEIGLIMIVVGWGAYYFLYFRKPVSALDGFAKCLNAKDAKMYGAWWCPHCSDQKEMFGYAFQYVNYTECSPENQRTIKDTCKQAGIKNFPTWQFADGSRMEGPQPLAVLGEKAGCRLP